MEVEELEVVFSLGENYSYIHMYASLIKTQSTVAPSFRMSVKILHKFIVSKQFAFLILLIHLSSLTHHQSA